MDFTLYLTKKDSLYFIELGSNHDCCSSKGFRCSLTKNDIDEMLKNLVQSRLEVDGEYEEIVQKINDHCYFIYYADSVTFEMKFENEFPCEQWCSFDSKTFERKMLENL